MADEVNQDGRPQVGDALARLGEKRGIEVLVEVLGAAAVAAEHDRYPGHFAGEALNRIAGERFYKGDFRGSPPRPQGNFEEAARLARGWWGRVRDTIAYDPERRVWVTAS